MIPFPNGPTCTMLEVGTTSITFSVEWPLDIGPYGTFDLIGKYDSESEDWNGLIQLDPNPAKRTGVYLETDDWYSRFPIKGGVPQKKAIFEVLYADMPWYYIDDDCPTNPVYSVNYDVSEKDWRKVYWKDYKGEDDERHVDTTRVTVQGSNAASSSPVKKPIAVQDGTVEQDSQDEAVSAPNRLWLYLSGLPVVLAALYFVRRKRQ